MRIFLTGGTGYIGGAVLDALLRAGHDVTALVRNNEKARGVAKRGGHPIVGNLAEPESFRAVAEAQDGYIHAAYDARSGRGPAIEQAALETIIAAAKRPRTAGSNAPTKRFIIYTSGVWILGRKPEPADESAPIDRLRGFAAVIAPTLDRVDRALWRTLHRLADDKAVVVFGPHAPTRDELGHPLGDDLAPPRRAGRIRAGSLDDLAGLADDLAALAGDAAGEWVARRPAGVIAAPFADPEGRVRALAVTSLATRAVTAEITAPPRTAIHDAATGEAFTAGATGVLQIPLAARSARLFVLD